MIQVENLSYEYPKVRALDNISFSIAPNSITALVGPNGAGKTTLLKCIAALTKPYSGDIRVNGLDVLKEPRKCHRIIGFLPDFFGLYDALTVEQALTYFALAQKIEKTILKTRVEEVAESLNLGDKLYEKVSSLSRGMRQRLAIGQTIIHSPPVLLLDEPASGLDPEARHSLAKLFMKLNRDGMTIVVSSHILSELDEYANDLLILRHGKIVDRGLAVDTTGNEKKICITVVNMPDNAHDMIRSIENTKNVIIEGNTIVINFEGDEHQQHLLLKALIEKKLVVNEFFVKKEGVQEQYMETVS
jgi:ABC-2 type transport system ATP-binding protein